MEKYKSKLKSELAQAAGFSFTVTDKKTISFTTSDGSTTAIDQILNTQLLDGKFIRNGHLLIQRGNEIFNAQGARVE